EPPAPDLEPAASGVEPLVGVWLDAQRGEVFSALYQGEPCVDGPSVEEPAACLRRWNAAAGGRNVTFVGGGALAYMHVIHALMPEVLVMADVPPIAVSIAALAREAFERGEASAPDRIRPIYIRRPDAELARERRADVPDASRTRP